MHATVVWSFDADAQPGERIEVLGFVHHSQQTWAVWRDDAGELHEIPTAALRMEPATSFASIEVPA